jgi:hypothetical protein
VPSTKTSKKPPKGRRGGQSRARVEELKRQQRRAERRRTMLWVGCSSLIGLAVLAIAIVPPALKSLNSPTRKSLSALGSPASSAACDAAESPPTGASGEHVGPDTSSPTIVKVNYDSVPPVGGQHYVTPLPRTPHYYARSDAPKIEQLVHNEEHGYTIVFYDKTVSKAQLKTLQDIATKQSKTKFIVAPWDDAYGAFPAGKHIGLATWGHKQLCGKASGAVVGSFMKQFPSSQSPEPNTA